MLSIYVPVNNENTFANGENRSNFFFFSRIINNRAVSHMLHFFKLNKIVFFIYIRTYKAMLGILLGIKKY